ncbi:hypothetical protein CE024_09440 [Campylobacter jejuni]|uniref:hypothetical protein n=3 Tax=Campylobacter jejuni TaxID=197 RepID=UPI00087479B5|nr:hypothetical protein [Campylobacter jejuni]EAJ1913076.1 hypothetical protein [Campylobacter jejuni]MCW1326293.1 hypothetical protein [Campylobacter jejuni]MCW1328038.1 hypothetical protein [Campylobacter jejuni]MCW1330047.1 hypothetical protein [Campylobacter jejuni]MCW1677587.1 hypothetical protein [Campylobacter jejuni]
MQKNIQDYIIDVHSCDPHSSNAYKQDLFDVLNEDFTKEYEFIDSPTLDDMVKHKQSDEVFKVFYKKDDNRVSNMQALNRFDKLKGATTKIILDSGFKPDK